MIFLFITNLFAKDYDKNSFNKFASWTNNQPSKILLCDEVNITKEFVKDTAKFWNEYFADYKKVPVSVIDCDKNTQFINDAIIITKKRTPDNVEFFHGMTYFNYDTNNLIKSIRIEINPAYEDSKNLLIHELGHAIGIDHNRYDQSHIMHADCDLY